MSERIKFEQPWLALEEAGVSQLVSEVELEQALKLFEEGTALVKAMTNSLKRLNRN